MNDMPLILEDYLNYMETIKGSSPNTTREYFYDLRSFFRFIKIRYKLVDRDIPFNEISIEDVDIELIKKINIQDLHAYIAYMDKNKNNKNSAKSRKVSSLKSFYNYLYSIVNLIDKNPAEKLSAPKTDNRQPVYLTLEESKKLLNTVLKIKNDFLRKRDYAIVMLFLNCGLRLSELSGIDMDKIKNDTLSVIGKGNKERTIYLNPSCIYAIDDYLTVRPKDALDKKALFLSIRKQRMSNRAIQRRIDKHLEDAGFDTSVYSTHKLRHTAATLMYKHGNVDIRALQEILGHENVSTTQIYTHIDDERLRDAVNSNPLSNIKPNED